MCFKFLKKRPLHNIPEYDVVEAKQPSLPVNDPQMSKRREVKVSVCDG